MDKPYRKCKDCARATRPNRVLCVRCGKRHNARCREREYTRQGLTAAEKTQRRALYTLFRHRQAARASAARLEGPLLAHCGAWHRITEVPYRTPCCGKLVFVAVG